MLVNGKPLVETIKERCRVCYTCVRECPAKAIRIADGQAEVIQERCIGCGNCVKVCSQRAKRVHDALPDVERLLAGGEPVAALVAPSFPAEFEDMPWQRFVGLLRRLGFDRVVEVGFGADLVADRTHRFMEKHPEARQISTSCPAIVAYVERYQPGVIGCLQPLVSPMVAAHRALRRLHGESLRTVFIGPCIAKKGEAAEAGLDAALTFAELRRLFEIRGLGPADAADSDFDPPHANLGAIFPITRGMLQAADIAEDLTLGDVVAADGRESFPEALREFESGDLDVRILEILCCKGCVMGAGMTTSAPRFRRRAAVSQFVRERQAGLDRGAWDEAMARMADLDLARRFDLDDQRMQEPSEEELRQILVRMGKTRPEDELNCGACGYATCREHAVAVYKGLAESEMCLPHVIEQLSDTVQELNLSHRQLASTQEQLMHSERLASMGQLAAGIAHEVNNPLGVVLLYAHMLQEECAPESRMSRDLQLVAEQADRCKTIVSGLLNFARQNKVILQPTRVADMVADSLRGCQVPDTVRVAADHEDPDLEVDLDRDQMAQVLANLVGNAVAAMPDGGTLTVATRLRRDRLEIRVADTGVGIPPENMTKIFEPFFTTKQMGKGTGLGLAVSYGIIKMHHGDIAAESNADPGRGPTGSVFTVTVPLRGPREPADALLGAEATTSQDGDDG